MQTIYVLELPEDTDFGTYLNLAGTLDYLELEINFSIYGKYLPATWYDPAEYPELDCEPLTTVTAFFTKDKKDYSVKLTPEQIKHLQANYMTDADFELMDVACWEVAEKSGFDNEYDFD